MLEDEGDASEDLHRYLTGIVYVGAAADTTFGVDVQTSNGSVCARVGVGIDVKAANGVRLTRAPDAFGMGFAVLYSQIADRRRRHWHRHRRHVADAITGNTTLLLLCFCFVAMFNKFPRSFP